MGIVIDGLRYRATGTAGEIGHQGTGCPRRLCGKRMPDVLRPRMARPDGDCRDYGARPSWSQRRPSGHVPAERIAEAARRGDPTANRLLALAGRYFGIGLSTIVQILNPDTIVIGGGLAHIGAPLLDPCMQALNENIHPVLAGSARLVLAELWDDAGMVGAGALAQPYYERSATIFQTGAEDLRHPAPFASRRPWAHQRVFAPPARR
jgi:glucokinase